MERFVARYGSLVTSILSGFERLVFRGTLLPLMRELGMYTYLKRSGVRLLDYQPFVLATSERVKAAALRPAHEHERPIRYLQSSRIDKEALARALLAEHPLDEVERGLKPRLTKCLHVYQYHLHPTFGFLHARIQTWFPFNVQVCLNGREWLARQMERAGMRFRRQDNCFTWLGDPERAQRFMDKQLTIDWRRALTSIARMLNPLHTHGLLLVGLSERVGHRPVLQGPGCPFPDLPRLGAPRHAPLPESGRHALPLPESPRELQGRARD
jgi:hypothetical protein